MIDVPLDRLLAIGEAQLEKDYKDFVETARRIQPGASPGEVMRSLSNQHPTETSSGLCQGDSRGYPQVCRREEDHRHPVRTCARQSSKRRRMRGPALSLRWTLQEPMRAIAKEAFYYVTPPEKEWTRAHKEEHLRLFNKPVMDIITIHEAYPGHYTQFLYAKQFPSKTRKMLSTRSNAEGWAHYAEQMMIEEGFGGGDPKVTARAAFGGVSARLPLHLRYQAPHAE